MTRPMAQDLSERKIQEEIEDRIAEAILDERVKAGDSIAVDFKDGNIVIE